MALMGVPVLINLYRCPAGNTKKQWPTPPESTASHEREQYTTRGSPASTMEKEEPACASVCTMIVTAASTVVESGDGVVQEAGKGESGAGQDRGVHETDDAGAGCRSTRRGRRRPTGAGRDSILNGNGGRGELEVEGHVVEVCEIDTPDSTRYVEFRTAQERTCNLPSAAALFNKRAFA